MDRAIGWLLSFVIVVGIASVVPRAEDNNPGLYDHAVSRAIAQLPRRPTHVAVIDAIEAKPEVRETLLKLDAFTLRLDAVTMDRSRVVYLVKQSTVLQEAAAAPTAEPWPRVYIRDGFVRDAAKAALIAASTQLELPTCQSLLSEFQDQRGQPLTATLVALNMSLPEYARLVVFLDGESQPTCGRHGVLAFTVPGSRVVHVCGRAFARAWKKDALEVRDALIHELLHSLGLGENPPTPAHITARVKRLCW
jgi:hypothetical protein